MARMPAIFIRHGSPMNTRMAVPIPDHFIPLLYIAGLAAHHGGSLDPLTRGYSMGSISMTCYGLEAEAELAPTSAVSAATLPPGAPADQSNI